MDIVLFGIQGSGKGTQAKKLASELNYYIFEAGAELRKMAASGTDLGDLVKSYIDGGNLVPFQIIIEVVRAAILARPKDQKILFDGIPRDADQAREFDMIMSDAGRELRCINFRLEKERGIQRILERAKTEGRVDDSQEEYIRRRMDTFLAKTVPVIHLYQARNLVTDIDANRSVEEVYEDLKKVVESF